MINNNTYSLREDRNVKFRKASKTQQQNTQWEILKEEYLYKFTSCSDLKEDKHGKKVIYCFWVENGNTHGVKIPYYLADTIRKHINQFGYINISFIKVKVNKTDKYPRWDICAVVA